MSVSGVLFEAPVRPPDYSAEQEIHPDYSLSEGRREELWVPRDDELGQHRYQCITPADEISYLDRTNFLHIEQLASSGMRRIFERFGFQSFYQSEQNTTTYSRPVTVEQAAITFPSSQNLRDRTQTFATQTGNIAEKLTIAPVPPKRFSGLQQIGALAQGQLTMSVEDPKQKVDLMYVLSYFSHDERIHFPAWLCLPGVITAAICRDAGVAMQAYNYALENKDWRRQERAEERIGEMTAIIDGLITVRSMNSLVAGSNTTYGQEMGDLLQWKSAGAYRSMTLRHIEKPAPEEVLVAKWH